ncbi:TRAP transporter large permease subunit [Bradyrhizobium sp.]|uniref:TRAP transporter large permease n=1 Tax=Bradyrhizobium sp. TaxID=376 RepID=UPI0027316E74|nr:TRAP transporter large permease subunit [Bradyrhizobium sp.]MDP1868193.1 TRAP transporter large permease subunit [Bradyrhizobium sp.]MDP3077543.1 TRAP transporter large permease subunit [Bradyrhizobium sp.]
MPGLETLAILCIVSFFVLLAIGVPVALTLAVSGLFFGYLGFGAGLFDLLPARIYGVIANYTLIAIPLFVFMGVMLEKSRIADDLMDVIGHLAGGLPGGMGIGIILVGVLMGATTGIVGATIVTLGLITLPALIRRGYHLPTACGTICASGTLGQIIPPSTILILLADILGQSVGTLFAAALIPGMLLAAIFCIYLLVLGMVRPDWVPAVTLAERQTVSRWQLFKDAVRIGLPPIGLVLAVLGSIVGGVAAPTEAASMGALGSILVVGLSGRFSWSVLRETTLSTTRITAGMMFILICAQVFALAFRGLHGEQLVADLFKVVPGGADGVLIFMLVLIFILGFFIEWIEISYIVVPLFLPLLQNLNVDMVVVATLIAVNLQTSFLTPPFGWALFYLRSVAPPEVSTVAIYKGVVPFIGLQLLTLVILYLNPQLATWLPRAIGW